MSPTVSRIGFGGGGMVTGTIDGGPERGGCDWRIDGGGCDGGLRWTGGGGAGGVGGMGGGPEVREARFTCGAGGESLRVGRARGGVGVAAFGATTALAGRGRGAAGVAGAAGGGAGVRRAEAVVELALALLPAPARAGALLAGVVLLLRLVAGAAEGGAAERDRAAVRAVCGMKGSGRVASRCLPRQSLRFSRGERSASSGPSSARCSRRASVWAS